MSTQLEKDLALIGRWLEHHRLGLVARADLGQFHNWGAEAGPEVSTNADTFTSVLQRLAAKLRNNASLEAGRLKEEADEHQAIIGDWTEGEG